MKKLIIHILFNIISIQLIFAVDPILIVMGPPGSGKGHFSQLCKYDYGANHISAGDLLRFEVDNQTEIGREISPIIAEGKPVDPSIMQAILSGRILEYLNQEDRPLIIDGFGGQDRGDISFLHDFFTRYGIVHRVIAVFFSAEHEVCAQRMRGRMVCKECAHVYNTLKFPPKIQNICDKCNNVLIQRPQDTEEKIQDRLQRYQEIMHPNYMQAASYFPYVHFDTNKEMEDGVISYAQLWREITDKLTKSS